MSRTSRFAPLPILIALVLATATSTWAQDDVFVVNFPEVQRVEGKVSVEAPLPHTRLVRLAETIVAPVALTETTNLVPGGTVISDGFGSVVLSLTGQVMADRFRPGSVGAILVPEEETVLTALEEAGQLLFPLRVDAEASPTIGDYFYSEPAASRLAFPRYRVFYFNTTDSSAKVRLFAYLAN